MGSGRLPRAETVTAIILLIGGVLGSAGCGPGSPRAGMPEATATQTATVEASPTPRPTATPDILASSPATPAEARRGIETALKAEPASPCPEALSVRWQVLCAQGDVDGDGKQDLAFLAPLKLRSGVTPNAAVVLVQLARGPVEEFPDPAAVADDSAIGRGVFGITDLLGDGGAVLTLLANQCGARGCSSRVQAMHWDGTAWRDLGPDSGIDNLDAPVVFEGAGPTARLTMHGGKVSGSGAGPSRASTFTYRLRAGRFELAAQRADPPEYLFHAIQDADAKFDAGEFAAAIEAYESVIADPALKDWRTESGEPPGRPALEGYALFRIAVATAAMGFDPAGAVDRTIERSQEPLFTLGIETFRRGYQERHSVRDGCMAATTYFTTVTPESDVPAYIRAMFFYGYANLPVKGPAGLCPL